MYIYTDKLGLRSVKLSATMQDVYKHYPDALIIQDGELPDDDRLASMLCDEGCETPCGCWVEPDGRCKHGNPSWLRVMGMI